MPVHLGAKGQQLSSGNLAMLRQLTLRSRFSRLLSPMEIYGLCFSLWLVPRVRNWQVLEGAHGPAAPDNRAPVEVVDDAAAPPAPDNGDDAAALPRGPGPDNRAPVEVVDDAAAVPEPPGPVGADAVAEGLNPPPAADGEDVAEMAAEMEAELAAEVEARVGDVFH